MARPGFSRIITRSTWSEPQATEILALVFDADPNLAALFVTAVTNTAEPPRQYDVVAQLPTGRPMEHVDLALQAPDWEVWIEAKIDTDEGEGQLWRYAQELLKKGAQNRHLVYLTRPGAAEGPVEELEAEHHEILEDVKLHSFDWRMLGDLLRQAESCRHPLKGHLDKFLKESGLSVPALGKAHIEILGSFREARDAFRQLFHLVDAEVVNRGAANEPGWEVKDPRRKYVGIAGLDDYPGAWACYASEEAPFRQEDPAWLEWDLGLEDDESGNSCLTLVAGLTLPPESRSSWEGWDLKGSAAASLLPRDVDGYAQLYQPKKIDQLIDADLETEVSGIADWIEGMFQSILDRPPAPPAD